MQSFVPGTDASVKDSNWYLPLLYRGIRYPRLARNLLENRNEIAVRLASSPSWSPAALGTYRTFKPRYLNYLVERGESDANGNKWYGCERRPVRQVSDQCQTSALVGVDSDGRSKIG